MKPSESGIPVAEAATDLGVPADALRLYVAAHKLADPSNATIAADEVAKLKDDLRARAGALRLDDLSKTALTMEWLAEAAVAAAHELNDVSANLGTVDSKIEKIQSSTSEPDFAPIEKRLDEANDRLDKIEAAAKFQKSDDHDARFNALEEKIEGSANLSLQTSGTLQELIHTQGKELDAARAELLGLRADVTSLRSSLEAARQTATKLEGAHRQLLDGLRAALGAPQPREVRTEVEDPVFVKAGAVVEEPVVEAPTPVEPKPRAPEAPTPAEEKALPSEPNAPQFRNIPATTPAKLGVKRAIEYNFLLERMGYRRYDSYTPDELAGDKVSVPDDGEIAKFIAKYELGCEPDEVEMISVQRGEHQMIQYQRIKKASGIKTWMGRPGR